MATLATITINQHKLDWMVADWLIDKANELESPVRFQYADRFRAGLYPVGYDAEPGVAAIVLTAAATWDRKVVKDVAKFLREHASYLTQYRKRYPSALQCAFKKAAYRISDETAERMLTMHDMRVRAALGLK